MISSGLGGGVKDVLELGGLLPLSNPESGWLRLSSLSLSWKKLKLSGVVPWRDAAFLAVL